MKNLYSFRLKGQEPTYFKAPNAPTVFEHFLGQGYKHEDFFCEVVIDPMRLFEILGSGSKVTEL